MQKTITINNAGTIGSDKLDYATIICELEIA